MVTQNREIKQWLKFSLPSPSLFLALSWPSLAQYDTRSKEYVITLTYPLRPAGLNKPKRRLSVTSMNYLRRLIALKAIMIVLLSASYARAADEPDLETMPGLTYPTESTEPEIAKFLNRCVALEAVATAVVAGNNRIWREHEALIAAEEYNRGLDAGEDSAPRWYHWVAIVSGSLVTGAVIGLVTGIAVTQ